VASSCDIPQIYVLAGANGAGKSSIAGAAFLARGGEFFNPDEATRRILSANPGFSLDEANSAAWNEGKRLLERAVEEKLNFALETTLGGKTITAVLQKALSQGIEVRIWFVGLEGEDLHIRRVQSRVEHGGHAIPEQKIRQRYTSSRLNLIRLLPQLTELLLYDNSAEADPKTGVAPRPLLILHLDRGKILGGCDATLVPQWAKPIVAAALNL
jgi:predicted ABC-type ATPase